MSGQTRVVRSNIRRKVSAAGSITLFLATATFFSWSRLSEAQVWNLESTIGGEQAHAQANFGYAVALDGDAAVVGQPGNGQAIVYRRHAESWLPEASLGAPSGSSSSFGVKVDIEDDVAIVGAWTDPPSNGAHIYRSHNGNWQLDQTFITDTQSGGGLGSSVAVADGVAVAGAFQYGKNGAQHGAAFVFEYDGLAWSQTAKLLPTSSDRVWFGVSADVEDDTIVVGERGVDDRGAVSIYGRGGGNWDLRQTLIGPRQDSQFGIDLSLSGDWLAIGAPTSDTFRGSVYLYHFDGTSWQPNSLLMAPDASSWDFFGDDLDLSGNTLVVGAASHFQDPAPQNGSAYVYQLNGDTWHFVQKLRAANSSGRNRFGQSVAVDGRTIMVGEPLIRILI